MREVFKKSFDIEKCKEEFQFLESEYGFKLISLDDSDEFSIKVTYKNLTTGIQIHFEPFDMGIMVRLIRLVNGQIPRDITLLKHNTKMNIFDVGDLISLNDPSFLSEIVKFNHAGTLSQNEFKQIIVLYATALKRWGREILIGDFGIFDKLEEIVKSRAQLYNQLS
jgi:hypothetical protein